MSRAPLIIAHRGASGQAPENTMAAFAKAVELGADSIELDVRLSADLRVVSIHDPTVARTTNGRGEVSRMQLHQLRKLDAGSWYGKPFRGQRIPLLEEVLDLVSGSEVRLLIEFKASPELPEGFEKALLAPVRESNMLSRVVYQSFNHQAVVALKRSCPALATAALFDRLDQEPVEATLQTGSSILAIKWNLLTPSLVARAHRSRLAVYAWTVNRLHQMKKLTGWGVDGIITNYPGEFRAAFL